MSIEKLFQTYFEENGKVKEDVIAEIFERDENAKEAEDDRWFDYNSTTLPR